MKVGEIDMSSDLIYTPAEHKTEHHGTIRRIYVGRMQTAAVLIADPMAYLSRPSKRRSGAGRRQTTKNAYDSVSTEPESAGRPAADAGGSLLADSWVAIVRPAEGRRAELAPSARHTFATEVRNDSGWRRAFCWVTRRRW
jgi:hypothetical protein